MKNPRSLTSVFGAVVLLISSIGWAATEDDVTLRDGNALLAVCGSFVSSADRGGRLSDKELVMLTACTSYVRGFTHGVALLSKEPQQGWGYCIDPSVPSVQVARVLVKYLRDNPQTLHFHPAVLVGRALREGFPCK